VLPPSELPLAEAQLTATASMRDEGFKTNTAPTANPVLDEYEARRCALCGARYPSFGFGSPITRPGVVLWACGAHRAELDHRLSARNPRADTLAEQASLF
jgi:hypothetical protein